MLSVTIQPPNLEQLVQWDELIARAPGNVFMSPVALHAAAATGYATVHVLQAWDDSVKPPRLVGVWALQERRRFGVAPAVLEALPFEYAFLSRPVIDPDHVDDVLAAFLSAIEKAGLPNAISLKDMDAEAPSYASLLKLLTDNKHAHVVVTNHSRPVVSREFGLKTSGSTRKKLRQDWNRLSAAGALQMTNAREPVAVRAAFEAFLALEHASWKGEQGTALLCNARDAAFVRRLIGDLADHDQASIALLMLDGAAVAAQVVLYCGDVAYTWKTAFDAAFARFSPGMLLIDKLTEQLFAGSVQAIDSCSAEGSFMTQLWSARRAMVDAVVNAAPGSSLAYLVEAGWQQAYAAAKALHKRLRKPAVKPTPKQPIAASQS